VTCLDAECVPGDSMTATFESFKPRSPLTIGFPPAGTGVVPVSRLFTWSLRLLCVVALGVTGYLALKALRSEDVAGCGGGAVWDCGFALHSRWSKVLNVPVSVPAFALYVVLLTSLVFCGPDVRRSHARLAWAIVTIGAIAAGLAAVWFVGLQVFVVGHLCVYCIAAHLCGLALCLAILWKDPLGVRTTMRLAGVSALGVCLLIGTQVLSETPQTYKVEHYATNGTDSKSPTAAVANANSKHEEKSKAPAVFEPPSGVPDERSEN
jgi:uncharacterized membrane protein